jgi:hypothetical protein
MMGVTVAGFARPLGSSMGHEVRGIRVPVKSSMRHARGFQGAPLRGYRLGFAAWAAASRRRDRAAG